jgi:hypothetical protein
MTLISILGLLGLGTPGTPDSDIYIGGNPNLTLYYDSNGVAKCYANGTAYNEWGYIKQQYAVNVALWHNETSEYGLYYDTGGEDYVPFSQVGRSQYDSEISVTFNDAQVGLWAIIIGFGVFAGVVGFKVLDSGISEASLSLILTVTFWGIIWGVFAVLSYPIIISIGALGSIGWFGFTIMYTIGVFTSYKSGGGGDGGDSE